MPSRLRQLADRALELAVVVSASVNCLVFPWRLSFIGPTCLADDSWAVVFLASDVPLYISVLAAPLRYRQSRLRLRQLAWRLTWDMVAIFCCLPWDAIFKFASSSGGGSSSDISSNSSNSSSSFSGVNNSSVLPELSPFCYSYGHLTRCFFAGRVLAVLSRATNRIFPALGEQRATMSFVQLVMHALLPLHWYACLLYMLPRLMSEEDAMDAWVAVSGVDERPLWARYVRSFDRGLLVVLGEGGHGETDVEIAVSMVGLLLGTGLLAFFTSRIVEILTSTNHFEQMTRQKIGTSQSSGPSLTPSFPRSRRPHSTACHPLPNPARLLNITCSHICSSGYVRAQAVCRTS